MSLLPFCVHIGSFFVMSMGILAQVFCSFGAIVLGCWKDNAAKETRGPSVTAQSVPAKIRSMSSPAASCALCAKPIAPNKSGSS